MLAIRGRSVPAPKLASQGMALFALGLTAVTTIHCSGDEPSRSIGTGVGGGAGSSSSAQAGSSGGASGAATGTGSSSSGAAGAGAGGGASTGSGGSASGGAAGSGGGSGGSSNPSDASAPDGRPPFDAAADAPLGPPTDWVYNIVNASFVEVIRNVNDGVPGADVAPISTEFYRHFEDNYDFLLLFAEVPGMAASATTRHVRWEGTPGIGGGPAFERPGFGSAARLKTVIAHSTLVQGMPYDSGPTLHEILHHWSMFLDASFGFDTATGHWGTASADGSHGGFDHDSVVCRSTGRAPTGTPPACPLAGDGRMKVTTAPFSPCCVADQKPFGTIELYLMGLVPAAMVPALWVMDDGKYEGPVWSDAGTFIVAMNYDIKSLHVVTVDDIVAKHGARPPATTRDFRAAFALVTAQPATNDQLERIARWARRLSGEQKILGSGSLSFGEATRGLATMTTRLRP